MKHYLVPLGLSILTYQKSLLAAEEVAVVSPSGSVFKMVLGLAVVLAVMALISWLVKRLLPNAVGQNTAIKVVGGVSVGSRERVVVLEVADRWLVVGVAQGQVSAIANLAVGSDQVTNQITEETSANNPEQSDPAAFAHPIVKPFSEWLKKSAQQFTSNDKQQ